MTSTSSSVDTDMLPLTIINLQLQQSGYEASLATTSRVMVQSLLDYLR